MKLSKECIEAIEGLFPRYAMQRVAATEALTNPSIYSKAGLISLEEAFKFQEWASKNSYKYYNSPLYTTTQLFQIYQEQKEK